MFWGLLDRVEAKTKSGLRLTKSYGLSRPPTPSPLYGTYHPKLRRRSLTYSVSPSFMFNITYYNRVNRYRGQYGIFDSCDYISFPKMMGSSAYFEVYSVGNVQIWRFSKSFNSLREPSISINSIGIILIYYFSWSWNLEHTLEHPLQSKRKKK